MAQHSTALHSNAQHKYKARHDSTEEDNQKKTSSQDKNWANRDTTVQDQLEKTPCRTTTRVLKQIRINEASYLEMAGESLVTGWVRQPTNSLIFRNQELQFRKQTVVYRSRS